MVGEVETAEWAPWVSTPTPASSSTWCKLGVVDPAKVTRSALENAASVAAMLLTTEALIAEKPEKKPAMPAMPGGGMGGGDGLAWVAWAMEWAACGRHAGLASFSAGCGERPVRGRAGAYGRVR